MKKLSILFFLLTIIVSGIPINKKNAIFLHAQTTYYGRAEKNSTYIYSSPTVMDNKINAIFEIPRTYFVKILAIENDLFYYANYDDIFGYVLKSEFKYTDQTPLNPFQKNMTFRVFIPTGADLRSSPNQTQGALNYITTIPFLETNLSLYGKITGEESISYKGNIWLYCKYYANNTTYQGYIYSPYCDLISTSYENNEVFEYVEVNLKTQTTQTPPNNDYLSITSPIDIILICAVSLPCILIIYFLAKPTKIQSSLKKTNKKQAKKPVVVRKIKKLKNSDYYELDTHF